MIKLKDLLTERFDDSKIFSNALVKKVASDIQKMFPKNQRRLKLKLRMIMSQLERLLVKKLKETGSQKMLSLTKI
jgi:3-dehydroquinate dehydratase